MAHNWEPEVHYNVGDKVKYHGRKYRNIQSHTSQGDWTPDKTPALWGQETDDSDSDNDHSHREHKEKKHHESERGEHHSAPHHHEEKYESKNHADRGHQQSAPHTGGARTSTFEGWLDDARRRAAAFDSEGPRAPTTWYLIEPGRAFPNGALQCGHESSGEPLYVSRVFHEGGIHVGKVLERKAHIGYGGREVEFETFELLLGNSSGVRWETVSGHFTGGNVRPVDGGHEADGTPLFVAQGQYEGSVQPGKCGPGLRGAVIPYAGYESPLDQYHVLCYV